MIIRMRTAASLVTLGLLAACQSVPDRNAQIEQARQALNAANADSSIVANAAAELERARTALQRADSAWSERRDEAEAAHNAYLVRQRVAIAAAVAQHGVGAARIETASAERERLRLEARTKEAQAAERRAQSAQSAAAGARSDAAQAEQQRSAALALAAQAEQQRRAAEAQSVQAEQQRRAAEADSAASRQKADAATTEARRLESELAQLAAKRTDRGLVVTLQDVLFEVDQAELKPGAVRTIEKLAQVMREHTGRSIAVEGFTDSTGTASYNLALAERRANAVKLALIRAGVAPERVNVRSFGEAYPVADNTSAAGRQLNRRVEIVFSDAQGNVTSR
jgi:outer membrane protein OmpA-like peptidoglycan-associated protein